MFKWIGFRMFKWPGRAKENLPGGSLKYLFVYLKVRNINLNVVTVYIYIYYYILGTIFYCTPYPNWLLFFRGFTHQPVDPSGELWREAFARSGSPKITRWLLPERAIKPRLMCLGLEGAFLFWHFVVQSNCYLSSPSAAKRAAPEAAPVAVAGSHVCQGSHTCVPVATPQNLGRVGSASSDEVCSNMTNKNAADICLYHSITTQFLELVYDIFMIGAAGSAETEQGTLFTPVWTVKAVSRSQPEVAKWDGYFFHITLYAVRSKLETRRAWSFQSVFGTTLPNFLFWSLLHLFVPWRFTCNMLMGLYGMGSAEVHNIVQSIFSSYPGWWFGTLYVFSIYWE